MYGNVAPSSNHYHAVWTDTRQGDPDVYTARFSCDLVPDAFQISAATGGAINFSLAPGPNHAGKTYTLFLTFKGTSPGVNVAGVQVDLNPDVWTTVAVPYYGSALFQDFTGVLDGQGAGQARFTAPPGLLQSFVGLKLSLAAVLHAPLTYATSPVTIDILK